MSSRREAWYQGRRSRWRVEWYAQADSALPLLLLLLLLLCHSVRGRGCGKATKGASLHLSGKWRVASSKERWRPPTGDAGRL